MHIRTHKKTITDLLSAIVILTITAGLGRSTHADTITICPDGNCDFSSIEEGLEAAVDGSRIEIGPGQYGMGGVHPTGRDLEIVGIPDEAGQAPLIIIESSCGLVSDGDLHVESLEIRSDDIHRTFEVGGQDGSQFTFVNCGFTHLKLRIRTDVEGEIILDRCRLDECRNNLTMIDADVVRVEGCRFERCQIRADGESAIEAQVFTARDTEIRQCEFDQSSRWFITKGPYGGESRHDRTVLIERCDFQDNRPGAWGLVVIRDFNVRSVMRDCTFKDHRSDLEDLHLATLIDIQYGDTIRIEGCSFEGDSTRGEPATTGFCFTPSIQLTHGTNVVVKDCDFSGNWRWFRFMDYNLPFNDFESILIEGCRFSDLSLPPSCESALGPSCAMGMIYAGSTDKPVPVTLRDSLVCGIEGMPMSGHWIDGGGNCFVRHCEDPCEIDLEDLEIHVPTDAPTLNAAITSARRGQTIVLAPGDHDLQGLITLTPADLVIRAETTIGSEGNTARIHLVEDETGGVGFRVLSNPGAGVHFEDVDFLLTGEAAFDQVCVGSTVPTLQEGWFIAEGARLSFARCGFQGTGDFPVINAYDARIELEACRFVWTEPATPTPMIRIASGELDLVDSVFHSAGVALEDSIAIVRHATFRDLEGGTAVIEASGGELLVAETWFQDNRIDATSGAVIRAQAEARLSLRNVAFCDNEPDDVTSDGDWIDLGPTCLVYDGGADPPRADEIALLRPASSVQDLNAKAEALTLSCRMRKGLDASAS